MTTSHPSHQDAVDSAPRGATLPRVLVGILVVALFLAGIVSRYADSAPDGLEKTAEKLGFADTATPHHTAGSPFADYAGPWAGIVGVLVVLLVAGGVAWLLRRRAARSDGAR